MAKSPNQKLKLLYLMRLFLERTDEAHPVTVPELIAALGQYGISAERKSLYDDFEALRHFGLDIVQNGGKYYVGSRDFELPELKLLVDIVQSSKFITEKKTLSLIKKLEGLASRTGPSGSDISRIRPERSAASAGTAASMRPAPMRCSATTRITICWHGTMRQSR